MIAKGAARNNPRQLAVYLMRVERYATGESVELLELQSGWASTLQPGSTSSRIASRLIEAFRDWQVLTEGTQQGRDGLYHAEISPAPQYAATMTPEQWKRAAGILGEELGFKDQPRAIVLHGGTDGRKHMHIVWARTDVEAMKIISDGYNFAAHEKASYRMELEFGHDFVPGKHHKRDRDLQDEFPRQEYDFAEAQMAEREGKTVAERKAEIRALQAGAANGQEFKKALEDAGYILAQGDRGYIVIDEVGTFSALSKNLQGVMKKAEIEAFMADVPLAQLPKIDEAKAHQKSKLVAAEKAGSSPQAGPHETRRTALSFDEHAERVVHLRKSCDNAHAFKNALETEGYVLAKGDQRGFVLVDGDGVVFSLSKLLLDDIKGKKYKAFTASIERATLPGVDEAKAIQARRQQEAAAKAEKRSQERSKFPSDELAQKIQQPTPAPEKPPEQARQEETSEASQGIEASKFLRPVAPQQEVQPPAPMPGPEASKFLRPQRPEQAPVLAPPPAPADTARAEETYHTPMPPEGRDLETERRNREKQRAAELRAEIEQREIAEQASKFLRPPEPESTATPVKAVPVPPPAPQKTKRRAPVPSDPWMAQVGGADKLSPAHLASAQRSYEAWAHKDRYDFRDYVSYVQKQWEDKELPPPQIQTPTLRTPAAQPAPVPKPADWTERELTPEFPALKAPTQPEPPKREGEPEEIYKIRKEIWQRQVSQMDEHAKANAEEYKRAEATGANKSANELEDFDVRQREARHEAQEQIQPAPKPGWRGALDRILNPVDEQKKAAEQQEQLELLQARQAQERRDYIRKLEQDRARELEALRDKQLQEQAAREKEFDKDLERHLREKKRALELQREMEAEQREKELNREKEEGLGEGKE